MTPDERADAVLEIPLAALRRRIADAIFAAVAAQREHDAHLADLKADECYRARRLEEGYVCEQVAAAIRAGG